MGMFIRWMLHFEMLPARSAKFCVEMLTVAAVV